MSDDHFTVDRTLIEAWASIKSLRPKDEDPKDRPRPDDPGNPTVNSSGEKLSYETHASTTDPGLQALPQGAQPCGQLSYCCNVLMENRNGHIIDLRIDPAASADG